MLSTIVKTGQVLDLFTCARPEWGVTEIAAELGVPKSNAHEITSSLASIDLLRRTGRNRYRLGWRIMLMAGGIVEAASLRRHATQFMTELAQESGETTHLAIWDGRRLAFISRVMARTGLNQPHARSGSALEAHCTASGKVLLADLPWDDVEQRVARDGLAARTHRSITDLGLLKEQVTLSRAHGIAINQEEADPGVAGIAVPIRGADGGSVAALGISMPADHLGAFRRRHERALRRSAERLSARITVELASVGLDDRGSLGA